MDEITRFDMDMDGSMEPSEHGQWVRYEDVPQPRTWVGLTPEERSNCRYWACEDFETFGRAIEAKLKEKNNG
jgi:hypothetical protein